MSAHRPAVLIIDDNRADVRLIEEALSETGLDLDTASASSGEEGLAYLRREGKFSGAPRPELMVVDLSLPRMNGWDLIKNAGDLLEEVRVVVLSGSQEPDEPHEGRYIRMMKPNNSVEFEEAVGAFRTILSQISRPPPSTGPGGQ